MKEFDELIEKYNRYNAYYNNKFRNDTPENQELTLKGYRKLEDEMGVFWDQMNEAQRQDYIKLL